MSQRLERPSVAAARIGLSVSQLYREVHAGRLKPPIKIGERASGWPSDEIDAFIAERIREGRNTGRGSEPKLDRQPGEVS